MRKEVDERKKKGTSRGKTRYEPPRAKLKGNTAELVVGSIHKGCSSSSSRTKKG